MKKLLSKLYQKMQSLWYVKYVIVVALGVLWVGFVDDNSLMSHMRNVSRIESLNDEISVYTRQYLRDQQKIRQLETNPKAVEKIARERYFMKADDEDIFVLSDDRTQ